ncbi:TPA: glycosyltransferase [Citrobacter koseri]|uniref:glycosyltransferase family 2 protein n=1 Tax=Citrobacter koseri TaxID=545 RepID=UPI001A2AEDC9|nr:glycosyltransferase [Citrobacter koseri]HDQ2605504.1 glycosyltransferase [Citrobacter koseri]
MNHPVVSIILPVYNVSAYLERCLDSLVAQTWRHLEIIAVNDGSTDNSRDILARYQSRLPGMRIVDQENRGLAEARNAALASASGEYIYCLDSDDHIASDGIETIVREMEKHHLDVLFFSTHLEFHLHHISNNMISGYYQRPRNLINKTFHAETFFNHCITERARTGHGYSVVVWGYAWRRKTYAHMRFKTPFFEDEYFTTELLLSVPDAKVRCLADRLYFHTIRNGSITTSSSKAKRALAILDTFRLLLPRAGNISNPQTVQCLNRYTGMLYQDAIIRNLPETLPLFSAQKMIHYLASIFHELYVDTPTENGLVLLHALINQIARDSNIIDESEFIALSGRIELAIKNKRRILAEGF